MPTISVIIPAYNAEATILKTIDSVLKQSYSDLEVIVVNDGSTDNTIRVVNSIDDSRMKLISCDNQGPSNARNIGMDNSSGEYITFIDADDLWTPDKLELQLEALEKNPEAGVAYSWTLTMSDGETEFYSGKSVSYEGNVLPHLLVSNFIASGSNVMVRRKAIESAGKFDTQLKFGEDWDYWLRLAAKWPFVVIPKAQILYRQSSTSASSKVKIIERDHFIVHKRAFQSTPSEFQHLEPKSRSNFYLYVAQLSVRHAKSWGDLVFALQRLGKALKARPQSLAHKYTLAILVKLSILMLMSPKVGRKALTQLSSVRASTHSK